MTNANTEMKTEDQTQKPVHKIKVGSIKVAIWEHQGSDGVFPSASFQRSYKTNEGWRNGHSYTINHLEDLQNAAELAKSYMTKHYPQKAETEENGAE